MKGLRKKLTFTALCLTVGLVVFGVSYTLTPNIQAVARGIETVHLRGIGSRLLFG